MHPPASEEQNPRQTVNGYLEVLEVSGIQSINDSVVDVLIRMQQLRSLSINGTGLTTSGVSALRKALPTTDIETE